jgi:hypothetical protein
MKYNILGLDQMKLIQLGLDSKDAYIIRWFVDFWEQGGMCYYDCPDGRYYWVKYQAIIDDLPILGIVNRRAIATRFHKMVKCGLFSVFIRRDAEGTYSYYRINESPYKSLIFQKPTRTRSAKGSDDDGIPLPSDMQPKHSSIKDNSIKNDDGEIIIKKNEESDNDTNLIKQTNIQKQRYENKFVATDSDSENYYQIVQTLVEAYNKSARKACYPLASINNVNTFFTNVRLNVKMLPLLIEHMDDWFSWTGRTGHIEDLGDRSISMLAFNLQPFYEYIGSLPTKEELEWNRKVDFVLDTFFWKPDELKTIIERNTNNRRWTDEARMFAHGEYDVDLENKCIVMKNGTILTKANEDKYLNPLDD